MLELWKLGRERKRVEKRHQEHLAKLRSDPQTTSGDYNAAEYEQHLDLTRVDDSIEYLLSQRIRSKAELFDVPLPPFSDNTMWKQDEEDGEVMLWLNANGRSAVRKLIYEEKTKRFEAKTLWLVRFWLPLVASLVGVIGALTGLFAVLRHTKP